MITILADKHAYAVSSSTARQATKIEDYVPVRMAIRQALDRHETLEVHVTHPVVVQWLSDFQQYKPSVVAWRTIDPAEDWTSFFGTPPAALFSPQQIVALDLPSLRRPSDGEAVDPLTWILGERLGDPWRYSAVPAEHIANFAAWVVRRSEAYPDHLIPLMQSQLDRWANQRPDYRVLRSATLRDDATRLFVAAALQQYDLQWRQAQGLAETPVLAIHQQIDEVILALQTVKEAIRSYWNRRFAEARQSTDIFDLALGQMSGLSTAELEALTIMLEYHPTMLDHVLFSNIQQRFQALPAAANRLDELARRVKPATPQLPDPHWNRNQWLRWATTQYMPYFAWIIRTNQPRSHQQACADAFSAWLFEQYPSWLSDDESPLLLNQYQYMRSLLNEQPKAVVVWLVMDGLTWWQGNMLRDVCQLHGLHVRSSSVGVAILPSITSVSKRSLVTGLPTVDLQEQTIAGAARTQLERSGIVGHVSYQMRDALGELQQNAATRCFVVLFNMIDVLAHQTTEFTDHQGVGGYFENLATELSRARRICEEQGRPFHVLIGSDHGSTLLPPDATNLALPQATSEISDVWEPEVANQETHKPSTRAAVIADPTRLSNNDLARWFMLDRHRYQLDQHYLVPRGYNYIKRRPGGWTHGGLTPEEVIVPLLHVVQEPLQLQPLIIKLSGSLQARRESTLTATIVNPNHVPLDDLTLTLSNISMHITIERLSSSSTWENTITIPPVFTEDTELQVDWRVDYTVVGAVRNDTGRHIVQVRRLQTLDTSFDDMF